MHDPDSGDPLPPPPRRPIFRSLLGGLAAAILFAAAQGPSGPARAQESAKKPNILVIMGDDVGWFNIGAYHRGIMSGKTPNLDKLAAEGMMFTDYYAEASCTAGRANFVTGELPIRTGLTTVGQAGSPLGMPDAAPTIATALTPRDNSVRTTWVIAMSSCLRPTASTSTLGISTISTQWRTHSGTPTLPNGRARSARAT
jgi:hypothetical protein